MTNMILRLPELPGAGRLGRHIEHDERSRAHSVEPWYQHWLPGTPLHHPGTALWERVSPILDQGDIGSCTGNAMAGWLGSEPFGKGDANEETALSLYEVATTLDAFPGQYPPDDTGSSGLAVAKASVKLGFIKRYRHGFTVNSLIHALQVAPVIIGIPWYAGFDTPAPDGTVEISGGIRGGHEVLVRGWDALGQYFTLDNSWGAGWGAAGSFRFSINTWATLRHHGADVTMPEMP